MLFDKIVVQMSGWTLGDNGTAVHDVETVGYAEAELEVLFDEQDANFPF